MRQILSLSLALLLAAPPAVPQQASFQATTTLVNVNVNVVGRDGKPVPNLTRDDFILLEDGKPQQILNCDFQRLADEKLPPIEEPALKSRPAAKPASAPKPKLELTQARDHRLIILFFDFSSMEPAEQFRAEDAAIRFLNTQMTTSDLVSIEVLASSLDTVQPFTADREALITSIHKLRIGDSSELASMGDTGADSQDQSGMFTADETEFNIFNADRKLSALQDAARSLAEYPQKKALVYISSGVEKTGLDNQSQLEATINTAVRANVAFYPIDARGLMASAPGGDASQTGAVGNKLYSGAGQKSLQDSFQNQQETLFTLASDTGGKALLDSNDLTVGIRQVQQDIGSYYTLSYTSTNKAQDGRYRRIEVRLAPRLASLHARLDYRKGYYASTTFAHMNSADKEALLQQAMESKNPVTDLPVAVEVDYFRLGKAKYFVPVSVKIPGSALVFRGKGARQATALDFIAQVSDSAGKPMSAVRDQIPLKLNTETAGQVTRSNIQYDTGFTLGPGKYRIEFVARENGEGKIGTFTAPFLVPDLSSGGGLRVSSLILSNQRQALKEQIAAVKNGKKALAEDPLIDSQGRKLVPNVTRVFRNGQTMFAYLEVYDPAHPQTANGDPLPMVSVAASLALYRGGEKVSETPAVHLNREEAQRDAVLPVRFEVPLKGLPAGRYVCQVNLIDEAGRKFAFPRGEFAITAEPALAAK
jgi:VWFA-related protein